MKAALSARELVWIIGLCVGASLLLLLRRGDWGEIGPLLVLLVLATVALLGEVSSLVWPTRSGATPNLPVDRPPADGVVGIAEMFGVRGEPNSNDNRFSRFHSRDGSPPKGVTSHPAEDRIRPLLGRVVLISVFIGRDGRPWSDAEIANAHAAMFRAGIWLEREAIRWNVPVNVDLADTYFVADDHSPENVEVAFFPQGETMQPFDAHASTKALICASRAADQLGYRDAITLMRDINPRVRAEAHVWLLHLRQAGHSLAIPLDDTELAGVSLAVCFAREANFPEPLTGPPFTDPVTLVHELLHLFGASDKYGISLRSFSPRSVTSREIMRLDESSLSRSRIDPLTAMEIGWRA